MFRERNPLPIGIVAVATMAALLLSVLNINTIVGVFGRTYKAEMSEAAGIVQGAPVVMSGVKVGRVKSVQLGDAGGGVIVEFTVTDGSVVVGSQSSATISVETVLGDKALEISSKGRDELDEGSTIPLARTSAPYDVNEVLTDLTRETEQIDVAGLAEALDVVSETVDASAPEIQDAFQGVSRLSETIASRDAELRDLLGHADEFSAVLADRNEDLTRIVRDGNTLFTVLAQRRDDLRALLVNVAAMAEELRGLVSDNEKTLKPTLKAVERTLTTLRENEANLDKALRGVAVYATGLGEVVSSGEYFTAYLQNLLPGNLVPPALDLSEMNLGGLGAVLPGAAALQGGAR